MKSQPLPPAVDHLALLERRSHEMSQRLTVQKRAVLAALLARRDHPTADQLYGDVHARHPEVSRATVYRVLEGLVRMGLINKQPHPGTSVHFDANTGHHHHLHCVRCDTIVDLDDRELERLRLAAPRTAGFEVHDFSVFFRGICLACREREGADRS